MRNLSGEDSGESRDTGESDAYVWELVSRLRVGKRSRRRIVAEVVEHFADIVAEEQEAGLTRRAAVTRAQIRMGSSADLAEEFNRDAAAHGLRNAAWALGTCSAMAVAASWAALQGWVPTRPWPNLAAFYLVTGLLVQVAVACAAIGVFLAVTAPWLRRTPLDGRPAALAARSLGVAAAALVPVGAVAAGNIAGMSVTAARVLFAAVSIGVPIAALRGVRAAARTPGLRASSSGEQVLDVIAAAAEATAERWAVAAWAYRLALTVWAWFSGRAPRLAGWLDLRHHPWRAAATLSVAAGVALKTPDLVLKGEVDLAAAILEAVAVFLSFTLLGGLLGLRASASASGPAEESA